MRTLIFSFLVIIAITPSYSQNTSIKDNRDEKAYKVVKLGSLYWMQENLRFEAEGSTCSEDCEEIRFYNFENLKGICPEGWRLPTMDEWNFFTNSFEDAEKARMMEGNHKLYRVDFLDKYNIFKSNLLNIKSYGRIEGGNLEKGNFIDYWTVNESIKDDRFHMHFTPYSIVGHAHKHHLKPSKKEELRLFPARCVCEASKVEESN